MLIKLKVVETKHAINYPDTGIGGVKVPRSLVNTMRGCLERDKDRRPTIRQLLSDDDPFLNPDRAKEGMVDINKEMLTMLIENTIELSYKVGNPDAELINVWTQDIYMKLEKQMDAQRPGYR